ncbi:Malate dehydrogenase, mitochondrial [Capsicum baccatum]|uniref:Malate dehydrogenase, mitochondrial n=1 Tax=Capsicum baccatum TaxID=33114 RepID=A0A2G2VZ53_CAPBA|nr:Malate dehydrogenase, mitochondrial [Capsicum baccatum]
MLYNEVLSSQVIDFETAHVFLSSYAGAIFANACLKGLKGVLDVVECSFVQSNVTELPFFASKVRLGKNGEEVLGLGPLTNYEKKGLEALKPELLSSTKKGIKLANAS